MIVKGALYSWQSLKGKLRYGPTARDRRAARVVAGGEEAGHSRALMESKISIFDTDKKRKETEIIIHIMCANAIISITLFIENRI